MASHYLDHAATTPMRLAAREAYAEQMSRVGNASSTHRSGRLARAVVEESREMVARALGAHPTEVVFTSGGTEADNLAVKGIWWSRTRDDPRRTRVVTSAVEHHAVLDAVRWVEREYGAVAAVLPVDRDGIVDRDALATEIENHAEEIALVTLQWANNEVGSIQPVREAVALAAPLGVPVHSDAVQVIGHVPFSFADSGLDAASASAHKFGGPVGVGILLARRGLSIVPLAHGGRQERGVRSGTINAAGIRATAVALEEAVATLTDEAARLASLQDELVARIRAVAPLAALSGPEPGPTRLPGNVHVVLPGCSAETVLYVLDAHGVEVSSGSACTAGVEQASHVLLAMGRSPDDAASTLRITLGHTSTLDDVDAIVACLPEAIERASRVGGGARERAAARTTAPPRSTP